jgi:TonB family protein
MIGVADPAERMMNLPGRERYALVILILALSRCAMPEWVRQWRRLARFGGVVLGLLLSTFAPVQAQSGPSAVARVRWPLADVVLVPDTCYGVWVLVAPNTSTEQWDKGSRDKGSQIVGLTVDPLILFQWANTARALVHAPDLGVDPAKVPFKTTPRLENRHGGPFFLLARATGATRDDRRFQFVVSDSAEGIRWKSFVSPGEIDELLGTIEDVVARTPPPRPPTDSSIVVDDRSAGVQPVVQLKMPRPKYPHELIAYQASGRVWAEYVVDTDGRVEKGSVRILLADHEGFAREAIRAWERASFRPATRQGVPVRQRVFQAIAFRVRS